jgi:hypothetical protein
MVVEPDDILIALHLERFQLIYVDSEGCQVSWLQVPIESRSFCVAHYWGGRERKMLFFMEYSSCTMALSEI